MITVPYVACYDRTRYALVCAVDTNQAKVLQFVDGRYDVVEVSRDRLGREFPAADLAAFVGKHAPTVERYLAMLDRTPFEVSDNAVQLLKEIAMTTRTLAINLKGELEDVATPKSIILDLSHDIETLSAQIADALGERALAAFVTKALGLAKPLARVKKDDKRVGLALQKCIDARASVSDNAAKSAKKVAAKKTAAPASSTAPKKTAAKRDDKPGAKRTIHALLTSGKKHTLEQFAKICGSSEVNCRTALTDLKNPKYAIDGKPLSIVRNEAGVYSLAK